MYQEILNVAGAPAHCIRLMSLHAIPGAAQVESSRGAFLGRGLLLGGFSMETADQTPSLDPKCVATLDLSLAVQRIWPRLEQLALTSQDILKQFFCKDPIESSEVWKYGPLAGLY